MDVLDRTTAVAWGNQRVARRTRVPTNAALAIPLFAPAAQGISELHAHVCDNSVHQSHLKLQSLGLPVRRLRYCSTAEEPLVLVPH